MATQERKMASFRFFAAATGLLLLLLCLSAQPAAAARAPRHLPRRPAPTSNDGEEPTSSSSHLTSSSLGGTPLPVVLWHGMGDWCCDNRSMGRIQKLISTELGTYVYSVRLGDTESKDRDAGFIGDVNAQVAQVCDTLASDPNLAGGFNAIGFSQGAQFLRAVVEVCPTLRNGSFPRVSKLISFGGQHQGVMEWPGCGDSVSGFFCNTLRALMAMGAYSDLVRSRLVQAQYFKDPFNYDEYLRKNVFLPHINNEVAGSRQSDYAKNLASLDLLLLYMWKDDETVVPRESSLFGVYNATLGAIQCLRQQALYQEDWIGLKQLDDKGGLMLDEIEGGHMHIDFDWFNTTIVHSILAF